MQSDSKIVNCPVEGCDYSGVKKSVLGHYSGKSDGLHPGGYQKAKDLLSSEPQSDTEPEPEPQHPSREPQSKPLSGATGNPTFGSAEPQPEPEPEPKPSEQSTQPTEKKEGEKVCPECSGPLYDFRQYETGAYHMVNGHQVYVRGDFQCSSCAKWWVDE